MDSRLRGNDGERFARMTGTHDCVVIDLLRHSRAGGNPLGITVIHTGVLFLNQQNLPCLGPFFQAYLCICVQLANIDTLIFLVRNARGFMLQPTRQWRVIVFPSAMYPFYCSYWLRNRSSLVITVSRSSIRGSVMIRR